MNKKAIALDSSFSEAYSSVAQSYFLLSNYHFETVDIFDCRDKANYYADMALQVDPENDLAWNVKGLLSYYVDWEKGKKYIDKALALNPNGDHIALSIYYNRGPSYNAKKELEVLRVAYKLNPLDIRPVIRLFYCLIANNRITEAEEHLEKNRFLANYDEYHLYPFDQAIIAYKDKDYASAIPLSKSKAEANPKDSRYFLRLAEEYNNIMNDDKSAIKYAKQAYVLDSTYVGFYVNLLIEDEQFEEANSLMQSTNYKTVVGKRDQLNQLWYYYYNQKNYTEALDSAFSQFVDNVTYNAPYALPVFSGGNFRNDGYNIGDEGFDYLLHFTVSKNSLSVAAVNEVLNYTGPNSVVMSAFSSWGPTDDGRIKPDISAKGVQMFSSVGDADDAYDTYSGTSMSAPNATGSLILLQQHYNNLNGNYMLASTLKGLALHTADEAGTHPGPDYSFGWGLLNIESAADVITNNGVSSLIIEEELQNGDTYTFSVQSNGIDDLSVSITWTDPPGVPVSPTPFTAIDNPTPMLINDLDLRVSKDGGATYFPWKLDAANFSAPATTGDNLVDNIEKVEIVGATGEYLIQVSHKGSVLTNGLQDFSLIVTGIEETLSTEDFDIDGLIIYPNPSNGIFTLRNTNNMALTNATVYDINGRYIKTLNLANMIGNKTIDISSVESGMYFLTIRSESSKHVVKLIKR